ncbi:hypothetical protein [Planomonospora algeriensis]
MSSAAPPKGAPPKARRARHAKSPGRSARAARPAGLWHDAWHDLRRRPLFAVSTALITVILVMAVAPSLFTSVDPYDAAGCVLGNARQGPSAAHWFGTDNQGCDTYARTVYAPATRCWWG